MALEIERKFLLANDEWRGLDKGKRYRQGYLNKRDGATVRVRTIEDKAYLTIKGPSTNHSRLEYEYPIPIDDALEMLDALTVSAVVEKIRYTINYQGFVWEVDEFFGDNEGLIVAEIELETADQTFPTPPWIGKEVSSEARYFNANLAITPFKEWKE